MDYKNLSIIGTSHIARESVEEIKKFIEEQSPDIIALELDAARFQTLLSKKKAKADIFSMMRLGVNGLLFLILGRWAQKTLGKMVGMQPGSEMLTAIKLARKRSLPLALIDQDISITLRRFSKTLTLKEKLRLLWDVVTGSILRKNELKEIGITSLDLTKVPDQEVINKMMGVVRQRYPTIYRVLVEERNVCMARNLANLIESNPDRKILAIVGAGHEKEIIELVRLYQKDTPQYVINS
jgi:pheromone shutdown-related protein TraB